MKRDALTKLLQFLGDFVSQTPTVASDPRLLLLSCSSSQNPLKYAVQQMHKVLQLTDTSIYFASIVAGMVNKLDLRRSTRSGCFLHVGQLCGQQMAKLSKSGVCTKLQRKYPNFSRYPGFLITQCGIYTVGRRKPPCQIPSALSVARFR